MTARGQWLLAIAFVILAPRMVLGQASITGTVKDPSGAVLPGVTVKAASGVLIEKTRSSTTDSAGLYRIVDLRPGTYTITFTLPGFSTVKREGIELAGSATLTVSYDTNNVEEVSVLVSGGLEESHIRRMYKPQRPQRKRSGSTLWSL